jgi:hypothetical protein
MGLIEKFEKDEVGPRCPNLNAKTASITGNVKKVRHLYRYSELPTICSVVQSLN